jgi:excisionase family DNA binding protein
MRNRILSSKNEPQNEASKSTKESAEEIKRMKKLAYRSPKDVKALPVPAAAEQLSISPRKLRYLIKDHKIDYVRIDGRRIVITHEALNKYLERNTISIDKARQHVKSWVR